MAAPSGRPGRPKKGMPSPPKKIEVTLRSKHRVNGISYGPGKVRVIPDLAQHFLHQESIQAEKEQSLMTEQAFIIQGGHGGPRKRQVAPGRFSDLMGAAVTENL